MKKIPQLLLLIAGLGLSVGGCIDAHPGTSHRDRAIAELRASLRTEYDTSVVNALALLNAGEALPELRNALEQVGITYERWALINAIHVLNASEGEDLLLREVRQLGTFGPGYFESLAEYRVGHHQSAQRFRNPEMVPYLAEAAAHLSRVQHGNVVLVQWVNAIVWPECTFNGGSMANLKEWWAMKFPGVPWPILKMKVVDDRGNVEFVTTQARAEGSER